MNQPINKTALQFLGASLPNEIRPSRQAYQLDEDVIVGITAIYDALGARKPKSRIVNELLRAAIFTNHLDGLMPVASEVTP